MRGYAWLGVAALIATGVAGCDRPAPQQRAQAASPAKPAGRIVVLPDSAIVVQPDSIEDQLARYLASALPAPRTFRFTGTEFERWQSTPNEATLRTMYAIVQILRAYPKVEVTLTGYTDDEGSIEDNRKLAQARVDLVEAMLTRGGIEPRRIVKVARPKADFIAPNDTPENRARNRRVELTVTAK